MDKTLDAKQLFITVNQALADVVMQVKADQLDKPLTAITAYHEGQTLRSYINILAYENDCVPKVLEGETDLAVNSDFKGDLLQDNVAGSYKRYTDQANQAVLDHSDLAKVVHVSYGDFPTSGYLSDITIQRTFAMFDVAKFIGVNVTLPDDVVDGVMAVTAPYAETLREYGVFQPEVKVPEDASKQDKLLGLAGRRP